MRLYAAPQTHLKNRISTAGIKLPVNGQYWNFIHKMSFEADCVGQLRLDAVNPARHGEVQVVVFIILFGMRRRRNRAPRRR